MTPPRPAVMLVACVLLTGCNEKAAAPAPVRPVLSTLVTPALVGNAVFVGTVQPQFRTDLGFRVLGRLVARPVNVGDMVEKGRCVAAIDPVALELAVRAAAADVSNSQAQLSNAAGAEGRQRTLLQNAMPPAAPRSRPQSRRAPRRRRRSFAPKPTSPRRGNSSAMRKSESDFDGVVTAVGAEVGQVVSPGQSVVTVARPDIREAVIDVADEAAGAAADRHAGSR